MDGSLLSFQLALRAGNEKEEGETADTVGCCSLRVEHIQLHPQLDGQEHVVEFDFLGKDSIRYYNKVSVEKPVSGAGVEGVLGCLGSLSVYHSQISIQNLLPRCALTLENGRDFGIELPRLFYFMREKFYLLLGHPQLACALQDLKCLYLY